MTRSSIINFITIFWKNTHYIIRKTSSAAGTFAGRSEILLVGLFSVSWINLYTSLRDKLDKSFSGFLYFWKFILKMKYLKKSVNNYISLIKCWFQIHQLDLFIRVEECIRRVLQTMDFWKYLIWSIRLFCVC